MGDILEACELGEEEFEQGLPEKDVIVVEDDVGPRNDRNDNKHDRGDRERLKEKERDIEKRNRERRERERKEKEREKDKERRERKIEFPQAKEKRDSSEPTRIANNEPPRSITIKTVTTDPNNNQTDTRRFQLKLTDWDSMFQELRKCVKSLYNHLDPASELSFQYVDDEQDLVSMSSPMELKEAVSLAGNAILKVHVSAVNPLDPSKRAKAATLRLYWDRGNTVRAAMFPHITLGELKATYNIPVDSVAVLNGRVALKDSAKTLAEFGIRGGDTICCWTCFGREVAPKALPLSEVLTHSDIPSVVLCDVRFNFIPLLCFGEIVAARLETWAPSRWLVQLSKQEGPCDGFEQPIQDYYLRLLEHRPTMNLWKRAFSQYLESLVVQRQQPFRESNITDDQVHNWLALLRERLWSEDSNKRKRIEP